MVKGTMIDNKYAWGCLNMLRQPQAYKKNQPTRGWCFRRL